jgi:mannose-6-phosphate isomerase-like protein (cupin superfamily)
VLVWPEGKTIADMTILEAGQSMIVPPGVDHCFIGVQPKSVVFESYWVELRGDDIVRKNSGE